VSNLSKDLKSWKTTAIGILTGLVLIAPQLINLLDGDPSTVFSTSAFWAGIAAMGFGVFAKDGDKSSEDVQ
jgi:hypothetical protein